MTVFYGLGGLPSHVKCLSLKELIYTEFVKVWSRIFNHLKGYVKWPQLQGKKPRLLIKILECVSPSTVCRDWFPVTRSLQFNEKCPMIRTTATEFHPICLLTRPHCFQALWQVPNSRNILICFTLRLDLICISISTEFLDNLFTI